MDPFYSYGERLKKEEQRGAEKLRKLRQDANTIANDSQVPVQSRKPKVFKTKSGKRINDSYKPVKSSYGYASASDNPYVAQSRNRELQDLVAKRAHELNRK